MTKISIAGEQFELTDAVRHATTGTLKSLKILSEKTGPAVTMDFLQQQISRLEGLQSDPEFRDIELYGDVEYLTALAGFVYLAKKFANAEVDWAQAESYAPADVTFVADEPAAVQSDVPKDEADPVLEPQVSVG